MTGTRPRVLYLADIRFPIERANGIQTIETCHALARAGSHVHLLVRDDTQVPPRDPLSYYGLPPLARLQITRLPMTGGPAARRWRYLATAVRHACSGRADVVFTRDLLLASLLLGVPRRLRAPLVYESHGLSPLVAGSLDTLLSTARAASSAKVRRLWARERRVWTRAEGYVTITARLRDGLVERFGDRTTAVVAHDGVRQDDIDRSRPRIRGERCVAAYAGHLYPWKGVDVFVRALARAPEMDGLIVGGHPAELDLARVRDLAAALGIAHRLAFTGMVPPRDVAAHLAGADILVLPNVETTISSDYSSPLKLFEYLAAQRAVVASDLPAFREVVAHERDALLVAPGDPESLAAALRRLAEDPDLAARLARHAVARARGYTWDVRATTIGRVIGEVVTASGARRGAAATV